MTFLLCRALGLIAKECDLGIQVVYHYGDTRMQLFYVKNFNSLYFLFQCRKLKKKKIKKLSLLDLLFFRFDSSVPVSDAADLFPELVMLI